MFINRNAVPWDFDPKAKSSDPNQRFRRMKMSNFFLESFQVKSKHAVYKVYTTNNMYKSFGVFLRPLSPFER